MITLHSQVASRCKDFTGWDLRFHGRDSYGAVRTEGRRSWDLPARGSWRWTWMVCESAGPAWSARTPAICCGFSRGLGAAQSDSPAHSRASRLLGATWRRGS